MNLILRTIITALAALAFGLSGAGVAAAHTALASSDPAKDANVPVPPTAILLTFTEEINPTFADVVVSDADGRNWVSDPPRVQGPRVTATVGPDRLPAGGYTVGYRVVSADGHPVAGSYSFTVLGVPGAPSATSTSVASAPSLAPPASATPAGSDTKTSILTAAVAGLALGAAIAFWQSRKRRRNNGTDDEITHEYINPTDEDTLR